MVLDELDGPAKELLETLYAMAQGSNRHVRAEKEQDHYSLFSNCALKEKFGQEISKLLKRHFSDTDL